MSENIRTACEQSGMRYLRLLRKATDLKGMKDVKTFSDCDSAAEWLEGQQGNILLTTGVKELPAFTKAITEKERIYARVLLQESIFSDMEELGLSKKQMICMQGPFSKELNTAMLKQVQAKFLVTKESGAAGGFMEKVEAAREAGAVCVVIRRPVTEQGYSLDEVREYVKKK